jgi:hypothetical protein
VNRVTSFRFNTHRVWFVRPLDGAAGWYSGSGAIREWVRRLLVPL